MSFFGISALILLIVAMALFVPVLITYLDTGLVPRLPTLVTSGILAVLAMLSFSCGLILDTVVQKHRQLYEIQLNILELLRERDKF